MDSETKMGCPKCDVPTCTYPDLETCTIARLQEVERRLDRLEAILEKAKTVAQNIVKRDKQITER